jgi:hypothetical protein
MKIEVPFYQQTMDFTCGAASLLMVLSFYDREFSMNREAEIDIWREGTSVEVLGMGRYGLSFPLLKRGYRVNIRTNVEGPEFLERIRIRLGEQGMKTFMELYTERMERVMKLGLAEERRENVTLDDISETLSGGGVPVLLTDASVLGDDETPHWIVVTGLDENIIYFNNPLAESGSSLPLSEFPKINGFHGEQTVVSVFRK